MHQIQADRIEASAPAPEPGEPPPSRAPLAPLPVEPLVMIVLGAVLALATLLVVSSWVGGPLSVGALAGLALFTAVAVTVAGVGALVDRLAWAESRTVRLEAQLRRAREEVDVDRLTGLATRHQITADLHRRLAERGAGDLVGVLFCDLDRLRVVNGALGHAAGDEVMVVAARRLSRVVREVDAIGRFGGDGFVVVSSGLPAVRDLEILAGRLIEALARPSALADGSTPVVTGTVGIAYACGDASPSAADLLRDADAARHRAKLDGGGRHAVFDRSLRADVLARLRLEQELRAALRDDEIEVHYQPLVDARSGWVDRVEALVRWNHTDRGTVLPSEFLPVAAQSQLMVDLGERVLAESCRQAVDWSNRVGRPITVAVNVAERQLLDTSLVDTVTRVLASTGLPAGQLELEVTEELLLQRLDHSRVVLRQLDLLGVRLAIDDFGTRQASLSRLKELSMVSTLKIDRLFVTDIANDPAAERIVEDPDGPDGVTGGHVDRTIVAAIVSMAASVGMSVVAEGVETPAQARVLADLGVDHLQGFLFARPGPADTLEQVLVADHRRHLAEPD